MCEFLREAMREGTREKKARRIINYVLEHITSSMVEQKKE